MKATGRFLIAALAVCLVTVWTCPAYCSSMAEHSAKAPASVDMTEHEHHHMSETVPAHGGRAMDATSSNCCEGCGESGQALGVAENITGSGQKSAAFWIQSAPRPHESFALPAIAVASPPLLEDTSPTYRLASPLRI